MANIHGVSTGRITKPKGKGRAKSAFQGSGRRMDGSVVETRKKAIGIDMDEDYALDQTEADGYLEGTDEDDDWAGKAKKKAKKGKRGDGKGKKSNNESKTVPVKQIANKPTQAKEETKDINNAKQVDGEDMEIVGASGNIEMVRRINIGRESARFALLVLPAEQQVAPSDNTQHSVPTAVKRSIFPCANGVLIRYDPSNRKKLREMSEAEIQRRGQKNPCCCDACKDLEGARKEVEMKEKEERGMVEMETMAAKSTRSGKSFSTQGRVLGD